ncbi:MAG: hypothetical protein KY466_14225, partial [Gemmatimonadetes bacterium]|nr:hypothetical protein [Gemmatimonadota bacterium]
RAAAAQAPPRLEHRGPAARLARRLRKGAVSLGTVDPELIRRADRLLARLATPPDLRTRAALLGLEAAEPELGTLLGTLERVLPELAIDSGPRRREAGDLRVRVEILAALAVDAAVAAKSGLRPVDDVRDHD